MILTLGETLRQMDYRSALHPSLLIVNFSFLQPQRTKSSQTRAIHPQARAPEGRQCPWDSGGRGVREKPRDLEIKSIKWKIVLPYPAMTTPSWECTSHKSASGTCSRSLTAPLRFCVRKRVCGVCYSGGCQRQRVSLSPTLRSDCLSVYWVQN